MRDELKERCIVVREEEEATEEDKEKEEKAAGCRAKNKNHTQ